MKAFNFSDEFFFLGSVLSEVVLFFELFGDVALEPGELVVLDEFDETLGIGGGCVTSKS